MTEDEIADRFVEVMVTEDQIAVLDRFIEAYSDAHPEEENRVGAMRMWNLLEQSGLRIIEDQPDHIVEFRPDGWQIQHSIECRIKGKLLDCPIHNAVDDDVNTNGPPGMGRYKATCGDDPIYTVAYEKIDDT